MNIPPYLDPPSDDPELNRVFAEHGLDNDWVVAWAMESIDKDIEDLAREAEAWQAAGFTPHESLGWKAVGFGPTGAFGWRDKGLSPKQASKISSQLRLRADRAKTDGEPLPPSEQAWQATPLPGSWIRGGIAAGLSPQAAVAEWAAGGHSPALTPRVATVAALNEPEEKWPAP